jgi:hypothetical protein
MVIIKKLNPASVRKTIRTLIMNNSNLNMNNSINTSTDNKNQQNGINSLKPDEMKSVAGSRNDDNYHDTVSIDRRNDVINPSVKPSSEEIQSGNLVFIKVPIYEFLCGKGLADANLLRVSRQLLRSLGNVVFTDMTKFMAMLYLEANRVKSRPGGEWAFYQYCVKLFVPNIIERIPSNRSLVQ